MKGLGLDPTTAIAFADDAIDVVSDVLDIFKKKKKKEAMKSQIFSPEYVRAASVKYRYTEIPLPKPAKAVKLIKQYSKKPCIPGSTFGLKDNGRTLWVSGGCRGDFQLELKPEIQNVVDTILPVYSQNTSTTSIMPLVLLGLGIFAFMKLR